MENSKKVLNSLILDRVVESGRFSFPTEKGLLSIWLGEISHQGDMRDVVEVSVIQRGLDIPPERWVSSSEGLKKAVENFVFRLDSDYPEIGLGTGMSISDIFDTASN